MGVEEKREFFSAFTSTSMQVQFTLYEIRLSMQLVTLGVFGSDRKGNEILR